MRTFVIIVCCGVSIIGAMSPPSAATAADVRPRPIAPTPTSSDFTPQPLVDWSGVYVGGFVGGAHGVWTVDFYRNNNHGHADLGADGIAGGAFVGYNYQLSRRIVLGVEGEIGATSAKQSNNIFDNDTSNSDYGAFGSIRGRVGYAFDRLMVYGTTGFAFASITNTIQKGRNAGEQVVSDNQFHGGYALGTGLEYAFTRNVSGRAEYLYTNYGTNTLYNADGNRAEFKNELHLLRAGVSYRF